MKWLRVIRPLWLREKLYFKMLNYAKRWPAEINDVPLEFAPVKIKSLLQSDYGHHQIACVGFYELELSRRITALARQGGLFVDVGANAGYFTTLWSTLNQKNEVYAFEPSPRNLDMLKKNISVLPNQKAIKTFDCALGKEEGIFNFDVGPEDQTGWGGLSRSASSRTIQVKACRLDAVIPPDQTISVLKIDAEGADTWVLMGAKKLLQQKRIRHIFFEANAARMQALGIKMDEAEIFLSELGYKVSPMNQQEFSAEPA